jgi:hypothetical protein
MMYRERIGIKSSAVAKFPGEAWMEAAAAGVDVAEDALEELVLGVLCIS